MKESSDFSEFAGQSIFGKAKRSKKVYTSSFEKNKSLSTQNAEEGLSNSFNSSLSMSFKTNSIDRNLSYSYGNYSENGSNTSRDDELQNAVRWYNDEYC